MTTYIFKEAEAFHKLLWINGSTQLAAQCKLPIGTWQCIFKEENGVVYNANTDNTFTRIN